MNWEGFSKRGHCCQWGMMTFVLIGVYEFYVMEGLPYMELFVAFLESDHTQHNNKQVTRWSLLSGLLPSVLNLSKLFAQLVFGWRILETEEDHPNSCKRSISPFLQDIDYFDTACIYIGVWLSSGSSQAPP